MCCRASAFRLLSTEDHVVSEPNFRQRSSASFFDHPPSLMSLLLNACARKSFIEAFPAGRRFPQKQPRTCLFFFLSIFSLCFEAKLSDPRGLPAFARDCLPFGCLEHLPETALNVSTFRESCEPSLSQTAMLPTLRVVILKSGCDHMRCRYS